MNLSAANLPSFEDESESDDKQEGNNDESTEPYEDMEQNCGKKTTNLKNVEKVSTTVDEDASYGNGDGGKTLVLSCLIQDFPILYLIDFF